MPAEKRDVLKAEFGKAISLMNKPESYLMINLADNQYLYFGGKKLDKGTYVSYFDTSNWGWNGLNF